MIGFAVLSGATLAYAFGATLVGVALGVLVAALALLAATTGFCVGCWLYKLAAPVFGVHIRHIEAEAVCAECSTTTPSKEGGC